MFTEVVDVATGYSNMAHVTVSPGLMGYYIRYVSGQTGFIMGASVLSGATILPSVASVTLGIHIPSSVVGGVPFEIPGPMDTFLGSLGTSGVVFSITKFFNAGT